MRYDETYGDKVRDFMRWDANEVRTLAEALEGHPTTRDLIDASQAMRKMLDILESFNA